MNHFPGLYLRGKIYWFTKQTLGVREFVSLKTGDLNEAVKLALQLSGDKLHAPDATVEQLVPSFLAHKKSLDHYTAASLESKKFVLHKFARAVNAPPARVTRPAVQAFYAGQLADGLASSTAASYLATIRAFFKWCVEVKKLCRENPAAGLQLQRVNTRARKDFCTPQQVEKLLAECPRDDLKYILYCGFHAGMRKQEIIESKAAWFDLANRQIHLRKHEGIQFKDREERSLPLTREFAKFLSLRTASAKTSDDAYMLHPEVKKGKSLYRYDFERYFKAYMAEQKCPHVTTHIMRHTFASLLASARARDGGPANSIYEIAVWLGDDVRVVQKHYAKLLPVKRDVGRAFRVG